MTSRERALFDPSAQANLVTLHATQKLGKGLDYSGAVDVAHHRIPVAVDYTRRKEPRFLESATVVQEVREERLALRDSHRLEKFLERQEKRMEYALHATPHYEALSNPSVRSCPAISFPKATRWGQSTAGSRSPSSSPVISSTPPLLDHAYKAVLPSVKGSVDMQRGSSRSGQSPPRSSTALGLSTPVAAQARHNSPRSESVQEGPRVLGEFLSGGVDASTSQSHVTFQLPSGISGAQQHRSTRADQIEAFDSVKHHVVVPDDASSVKDDSMQRFFTSKKDALRIRDLHAPDLKKVPGRQHPPIGALERKLYEYDNPCASRYIELHAIESEQRTQGRRIPCVSPIGKNGREAEQPPPVAPTDPLVRAAKFVQEELTEALSPEYRQYLHRQRIRARSEKEKAARLAALSKSSEGAKNGTSAVDTTAATVNPSGSTTKGDGIMNATPSKLDGVRRKKRVSAKETPKPLYKVSKGGARLEVDLNVLFSGSRFKELLAMHDFLIEKELNGGRPPDEAFDGNHDEGERSNHTHDATSQHAGVVHFGDMLGSPKSNASADSDEQHTFTPKNIRMAQKKPPVLTIAEKQRRGIPLTFDEAYEEAERREHLLRLKCLSLTKDSAALARDSNALSPQRKTLASFGPTPGRYDLGAGSDVDASTQASIAYLQRDASSPTVRAFRGHVKLKEFYDKMQSDRREEELRRDGAKRSGGGESLRRMSMLM